jgi:hypothetical protein
LFTYCPRIEARRRLVLGKQAPLFIIGRWGMHCLSHPVMSAKKRRVISSPRGRKEALCLRTAVRCGRDSVQVRVEHAYQPDRHPTLFCRKLAGWASSDFSKKWHNFAQPEGSLASIHQWEVLIFNAQVLRRTDTKEVQGIRTVGSHHAVGKYVSVPGPLESYFFPIGSTVRL